MEKIKSITHSTLIPIGVVLALASSVVSIVWLASSVNAKVDFLTAKDSPSRTEFNVMREDVTEIKQDVKLILRQK